LNVLKLNTFPLIFALKSGVHPLFFESVPDLISTNGLERSDIGWPTNREDCNCLLWSLNACFSFSWLELDNSASSLISLCSSCLKLLHPVKLSSIRWIGSHSFSLKHEASELLTNFMILYEGEFSPATQTFSFESFLIDLYSFTCFWEDNDLFNFSLWNINWFLDSYVGD